MTTRLPHIDGVIVSRARLAVEASGLTCALTYIKCGRIDRALTLIEEARDMIRADLGEQKNPQGRALPDMVGA